MEVQFVALLCGHELMDFIEKRMSLTLRLLVQHNQPILGWILSLISSLVLASLALCAMLFDTWNMLKDMFISNLNVRIFSLRQCLQPIIKGAQSINEFVA